MQSIFPRCRSRGHPGRTGTIGPNWSPTGNFLVRLAFRQDFVGGPYSGPRKPCDDGTSNRQTMLGFDMIQRF